MTRRERRALRHHVPEEGRIDELAEPYRGPWLESRSEFDRQLLALSTAGVGLLVGLASTHPPAAGAAKFAIGLALLGFAATVLVSLRTLWLDARFLEAEGRLAAGDDAAEHERLRVRLRALEKVSVFAFGGGVAATVIVGLLALYGHW